MRYETDSLLYWRKKTDLPLVALAIGSLPFLLLEIASDRLPDQDKILLLVVNILVGAAFLTDYLVELFLATNRRLYVRHEWSSLLIVIAQCLALLPSLTVLASLRVLRIVRVGLVVARATAIGGSVARMGRSFLRRRAASIALSVAGLTWMTSAVAFTLSEDVGDGRRIGSFFDALWWSAATITTVGYGDVYPITAAGRIIGVFTMIIGISTFALVTARVAQFLVTEN